MWEPVIGLEVHVQLATQSKIFSGASTSFGASPNTQACAIDLGLPGVLPVLNEQAVRMAVMFGLATHAEIAPCSVFARKNYFYPDLPKGYQISQYEQPIVGRGYIDINLNGQSKRIRITRAHLEEDAGKSIHDLYSNHTAIDLNRAGTALLEIVSEPDLRCAQEAVAYLKALHAIITYLGISDGNMAEGSMRCDVNVSIRPKGQAEFGTRAEIKNVNSFRFVEKAIEYEIERQIDLLEQGGTVIQETRLFDSAKNETRSMRGKEEANDYRYFPDPDLLPVAIDQALLAEIRKSLPELPEQKLKRFAEDFQLSEYDANILVSDRQLADYFEKTLQTAQGHHKQCANWIISELLGRLNKEGLEFSQNPISPEHLGLLILRITDGTLSGKIAKTVFDAMWQTKVAPDRIIEQQGLKQVTDSTAIEQFIDQVIQSSPKQVEQFVNSPPEKQKKLTGYFVGQVMKLSQGKANPQQVNEVLLKKLAALS